MKKFDFRRQLKNMKIEDLVSLKDYHLDLMLSFIGFNDKESSKHSRYIGYIDDKISKLKLKN